MSNSTELTFKVSSALKNIIGRDLINDRYIAIFELVKNSYDAGAHKVLIKFENIHRSLSKIIIADDGCGMSYSDIRDKWLFVAYSEKKEKNSINSISRQSYRDNIKRRVAGAKGVGRFSCDRLGESLVIYTKPKDDQLINKLYVNWNDFEEDDTKEFMNINVQHSYVDNLPYGYNNGTIIEISSLREQWTREDLLNLKKSLMRLVNPEINSKDDVFEISMDVEEELSNDNAEIMNYTDSSDEVPSRNIVNGQIVNDIYKILNIRTTNLDVSISENGKEITTSLSDRGVFIFKITEKNTYSLLENIHFSLFYLTPTAKASFTKLMGVEPVNYGSVFIYKNGFRIYPYGEPGRDFFDIDRRKTQGYSRFLGTRELMGRVQILGDNNDLTETTSRDGGLINTPTFRQLTEFFKEKALKIIEKYVVDIIQWGEPSKDEEEQGITEGIQPDQVIDKIINQFIGFARKGEIINVEYNPSIAKLMDEMKEKSLENSLRKLENIASKSNNEILTQLAKKVQKDTVKLYKQKVEVEKENEVIKRDLSIAKGELTLRKKQNYFLKSSTSTTVENLLGASHVSRINALTVKNEIKNILNYIKRENEQIPIFIIEKLAKVDLLSQKIYSTLICAEDANFSTKSDIMVGDVCSFIEGYISNFYNHEAEGINVLVENKVEQPMEIKFKPSNISIILDNLVSNSEKARAQSAKLTMKYEDNYIILNFIDDGDGIDKSIINPEILFELGITTTRGSGIGLYHVKQIIQEMGGTAKINANINRGFEIEMRMKV